MVKRWTYSAGFKVRVVLEIISSAKSQAEVASEHRIKSDILACWKRQFLENASSVFKKERPNHEAARIRASPSWSRNWGAIR